MKVDNILQTIGQTPHVRINRLFGPGANVGEVGAQQPRRVSSRTALRWRWWRTRKSLAALQPGGTIIEPGSQHRHRPGAGSDRQGL